MDILVYPCNSSTREAEEGGLQVWDQFGYIMSSEPSWFMQDPMLKTKKRKAKQAAKSQTQESTVAAGWFSTSLQVEEGQVNDT